MDIEVVIKKTAVYSLLTALLTGLFVAVILLGNYLLGNYLGQYSMWFSILGAFAVALVFQPLREAIQDMIDRVFFRARYDYQRILNKYSHTLAQPMTDLDRFSRLAPYLLTKAMKLSGASVMVLDRESHCYVVRAGVGKAEERIGEKILETSPLIKELLARKKAIVLEEIEERAKTEERFKEITEEMKHLRAALVIPSISESPYFKTPTLLSTINLGKKMSDEAFSREDANFLKTLANQAAISIEYAFIFEELRRNQEQLVKSEKLAALGTSTAGIAHELKNPLTYLMTIAQAIPQGWDNQNFRESVMKMFPPEVERMKLIIDGLSDYSKTHELRLEPTDIVTVLEKTLAVLSYEIKKNNVFLVKHYPAENEPKAFALADKDRLVQVFMNIIANAAQAMGPKGGDLCLTVRAEGTEVRVSVADTGPGIPEEKLKKVFDPFFTTKDAGTGLGLSITKKIVDEHHGSIYVDSHVGEGTTFSVCLPRAGS